MYNTFIGNKNKDHKDVGIGKIFFFFFFLLSYSFVVSSSTNK